MPQTRTRPHGSDIRPRSKPKAQGKTIEKGPSLNALKKRKRNLRRLLEHAEKLPADIRINHERELASCAAGIEDAQNQAELSRMIKKYHMVRFFERRKAERYLKKARQNLIQCADPSLLDELTQQVHLCDIDLNYTQYSPLNEAYSSLYMTKNKEDEKADLETGNAPTVNRSAPMWQVVEKASAQNKLQDLREGKLRRSQKALKDETDDQDGSKYSKKTSVKAVKGTSKEKKTKDKPEKKDKANSNTGAVADMNMDDDDDDDETGAGFFE